MGRIHLCAMCGALVSFCGNLSRVALLHIRDSPIESAESELK